MKPAIRVENLSKSYRLGSHTVASYRTFRESIANTAAGAWHGLRRRLGGTSNGRAANGSAKHGAFWALKDVSFEVRPGEVVGIIGRNGAGKSTILKILSRITEPTAGRCEVRGRMASLLEVGTGFHPELTGRDNIYLNGSLLGMGRKEIDRKFDQIVAFSEIEQFLDTPVKRYSSGMYVRLAFAVAAHLDPEILVVDEVLAVGDAQFQKKCLGMMQDVASRGRTVLFVSHNMTALQNLCSRAVWLEMGELAGQGPVKKVILEYLKEAYAPKTEQVWEDPAHAPGNDVFRLHRVSVRPSENNTNGIITVRSPIQLEFEYWNLEPEKYLNLSVHVYNEEGVHLFNTFPNREPHWHGKPFRIGLYRSVCHVPGGLLNDGTHRVQVMAVEDQARVIHNCRNALVFEVADEREPTDRWHGKWQGVVRPDLVWKTDLIHDGVVARRALDQRTDNSSGV